MFGWNKEYKWGIALGGGGARGFAHLGVLQGLSEKGIQPDIISGVSAGAIAGALIASGKSPEEAFGVFKKYTFNDFTKFRLPKEGLFSLGNLRSTIEQEIEVDNIEELKIPLILGVSNILTGKSEYITEGKLSAYVEASASIPVLFSPVEINGNLYSDGGLLDNLPFSPLKSLCKKVIAVSISPVQKLDKLSGIISIAARTFQLSVANSDEAEEACDYFIEPPELCNYDLLDTTNADAIFDAGYKYAKSIKIKT